jgi:ClpP class serine protease
MGALDILWLFFMISALQPVLRQKMLESSRLRILHRFEGKRKSRVIALVHRQETMSLLGFPLMRYIDVNDSEDVLRAIKLTDPEVPIDLIVHTPGGLVLAAGQIAHALKRHPGKVTVFVPHYAMSGGTLIALTADEIVMDPNAVLGPVDPQLGQSPAASVLTVLERKKPEDIDDQTFILADVSRKAIVQVRRTVQDLLPERLGPEPAAGLAEKLATGTWTHDYPIMTEEAKTLGLPVSSEMPEEVYQFMSLFPQPTRTRSAVEYIPLPYRGRSGQGRAGG